LHTDNQEYKTLKSVSPKFNLDLRSNFYRTLVSIYYYSKESLKYNAMFFFVFFFVIAFFICVTVVHCRYDCKSLQVWLNCKYHWVFSLHIWMLLVADMIVVYLIKHLVIALFNVVHCIYVKVVKYTYVSCLFRIWMFFSDMTVLFITDVTVVYC
jgi:hypothetical protein